MPPRPVAKFRHTRSGFTVRFVDESTFSGPTLTRDWRFFEANGAALGRSTDDDPRKNFPPSDGPRDVKVRLTVKDKWGQTDSTTRTITVAPVPAPAPTPAPTPPAPVPPPPPPAPEPVPQPSGTSPAELPRSRVDVSWPSLTGRTLRVPESGNLQTVLSGVRAGDTVLLPPRAVYRGRFELPAIEGGWAVLRTDTALPAEGTRVTPESAAGFAKLVGGAEFALSAAAGVRGWRIAGVEITTDPALTEARGQVVCSGGSRDIVLDRCYIHGHETLSARRAVLFDASDSAIIECHVSDAHMKGFDSQAVIVIKTPGRLLIRNNFLEGAGENMMVGGALPPEGVVPSDIEILRNHFFKPLSWRNADGTSRWTVKNSFELKIGRRILIEGNVLENHWKDAQDGDMVNIKFDQAGCTWCGTDDITMRYNIFRNSSGGIQIGGVKRMLFAHNLFENIAAFPGTNAPFSLVTGNEDLVLDRNTSLQHGKLAIIDGGPKQRARITGNLLSRGAYGWKGSGTGEALGTLARYFPGAVFEGNAIVGADPARYPAGNRFPATPEEARQMAGVGVDRARLEAATKGVVR